MCTGGRKKKLKVSMLATATSTAYAVPQKTAIGSTAKTNSTPRLRTGTQLSKSAIAAATTATATAPATIPVGHPAGARVGGFTVATVLALIG